MSPLQSHCRRSPRLRISGVKVPHDISSEARPKAIISCEDSPTLGLYRHHIQQPRSREHLLSICRDNNSNSKYEGEPSAYVRRAMANPAPNSDLDMFFNCRHNPTMKIVIMSKVLPIQKRLMHVLRIIKGDTLTQKLPTQGFKRDCAG